MEYLILHEMAHWLDACTQLRNILSATGAYSYSATRTRNQPHGPSFVKALTIMLKTWGFRFTKSVNEYVAVKRAILKDNEVAPLVQKAYCC